VDPAEAIANTDQKAADHTSAAEASCWLTNPRETTKRQTCAQWLAEQPEWQGPLPTDEEDTDR
jgi:hypothetical protein